MSINTYGALFSGKDKVTPAIKRAAESAQRFGMLLIRARTPIKTGKLRSGWQSRLAGRGIQIKNDVHYAIYQEMGTRHFPGRHMVGRSLPEIQAVFRQELAKEMGRNLAARVIGTATGSENPAVGSFRSNDRKAYQALTSRGKGAIQIPDRGFRPKGFKSVEVRKR